MLNVLPCWAGSRIQIKSINKDTFCFPLKLSPPAGPQGGEVTAALITGRSLGLGQAPLSGACGPSWEPGVRELGVSAHAWRGLGSCWRGGSGGPRVALPSQPHKPALGGLLQSQRTPFRRRLPGSSLSCDPTQGLAAGDKAARALWGGTAEPCSPTGAGIRRSLRPLPPEGGLPLGVPELCTRRLIGNTLVPLQLADPSQPSSILSCILPSWSPRTPTGQAATSSPSSWGPYTSSLSPYYGAWGSLWAPVSQDPRLSWASPSLAPLKPRARKSSRTLALPRGRQDPPGKAQGEQEAGAVGASAWVLTRAGAAGSEVASAGGPVVLSVAWPG